MLPVAAGAETPASARRLKRCGCLHEALSADATPPVPAALAGSNSPVRLHMTCLLTHPAPSGLQAPSLTPLSASSCLALSLQVSWCTTPDIGGVAAAVIQAGPAQWGGKTVGVAGEHATLQEVADAFTRVFGKKVGVLTAGRL